MARPGHQGGQLREARFGGSLEDFARQEVLRALGTRTRIRGLRIIHAADTSTVVLVSLAGPPYRVVFKVAERDTSFGTDFERTAAVVGLARAAGVPVAEVLAVGTSGRPGPWQYLLQQHVAGLPWRRVRPLLDEEERDAADRQIAESVLAVHSVCLDGYGELDRSGRSPGATLATSLRRRADRILGSRDRAAFGQLLDRERHLFVDGPTGATLCHDDLHHDNILFERHPGGWFLSGILDWDKAWAGPAESDVARMSLWDDMAGHGFWQVYRAAVPGAPAEERRRPIYQLLWCLEFDDGSDRHAADTAELWRRCDAGPPGDPGPRAWAPDGPLSYGQPDLCEHHLPRRLRR